jgi:ferredoxin-NADP reductase
MPLAATDVYVAGPAPFVAAAADALQRAGLPSAQLRSLAL